MENRSTGTSIKITVEEQDKPDRDDETKVS